MLVIEWCSRAVWCSHSFAIFFFFVCLFAIYSPLAMDRFQWAVSYCEWHSKCSMQLEINAICSHSIQLTYKSSSFFVAFFPSYFPSTCFIWCHQIKWNSQMFSHQIFFRCIFPQSVWNIGWSDMLIPREFISFIFITNSQIVIPFSSLEKQ